MGSRREESGRIPERWNTCYGLQFRQRAEGRREQGKDENLSQARCGTGLAAGEWEEEASKAHRSRVEQLGNRTSGREGGWNHTESVVLKWRKEPAGSGR